MTQKTQQQIFDETVWHLANQGGPARSSFEEVCRYRGYNGFKCAVGYWIPDENYSPQIEGAGLTSPTSKGELVRRAVPEFIRNNLTLANRLQRAHDQSEYNHENGKWIEPWGRDGVAVFLNFVAETYCLSVYELNRAFPR